MNIKPDSIQQVERFKYVADRGVRISDALILRSADVFYVLHTTRSMYVSSLDTGKACEKIDDKRYQALVSRSKKMPIKKVQPKTTEIVFEHNPSAAPKLPKLEVPKLPTLVEWPKTLPIVITSPSYPLEKSATNKKQRRELVGIYRSMLPQLQRALKKIMAGRPDEENIRIELVNTDQLTFTLNMSPNIANIKQRDFMYVRLWLLSGDSGCRLILNVSVDQTEDAKQRFVRNIRSRTFEEVYALFKRIVLTLRRKAGVATKSALRTSSSVSNLLVPNRLTRNMTYSMTV